MKLEDMCCSLDNAENLKEIGIKQESLFCWFEKESYGFGFCEKNTITTLELSENHKYENCERYSAFTDSELINMLPYCIKTNIDKLLYLTISKESNFFYVRYTDNRGIYIIGDNEKQLLANSLAELLIYLVKKKLVPLEEINERI